MFHQFNLSIFFVCLEICMYPACKYVSNFSINRAKEKKLRQGISCVYAQRGETLYIMRKREREKTTIYVYERTRLSPSN